MSWEKGKSGNPRGRPKGAKAAIPSNKAIKDAFKKNSNEALVKLLSILRTSEDEGNQLKAAVKILDVTYNIVVVEEREAALKKNGVMDEEPSEQKPPVISLRAVT